MTDNEVVPTGTPDAGDRPSEVAVETARPSPFPRTTAGPDAQHGTEPGADDAAEAAATDAAEEDEHDSSGSRRTRSRLYGWLIAALALVCAGLATVGVLAGLAVWRGHNEDLDRAAATDAARAEVTNILQIDPKTIDADVQRIIDGSTGEFKNDFTARKDVFASVVKEQNVTSTSAIRAIGVESSTDTQASVLVAATSTVTNTASPGQPQARDYRIRVQLQKVTGRWLAAQIEFVP